MGAMSDVMQNTDAETARVDAAIDALLAENDPTAMSYEEFRGAQFDAGLAWVHFDEGDGGLGVNPKLQKHVETRLRDAGAKPMHPAMFFMHLAGPTIGSHGSDETKQRFLRPMFTGEERWCQLFSEPGAGSDFAGLATRAVKDGDEWVVNGQKVWTSLAHHARWGCLVTRTDPDAPKHKGLSYFVVDMHEPGVEVRPLRQMTGGAEFNEVYFTDARIPDSERLGDVGDGWRVALTTLMNERVAIGGAQAPRGSGAIAFAVDAWNAMPDHRKDVATQDELMKLWSKAEAARLTNIRASQNRAKGDPGPEGSTGKLAYAENNKDIYAFAMQLLGADGMLYRSYDMDRDTSGPVSPQQAFLRSRANSIEGGTSEVMRNILGERVLGLPGDVRVDKDLPFNEVPHS